MIIVEYNSNNSGGDWWLEDKDWKALEKAGWKVIWAWEEFKYKNGYHVKNKEGFPTTKTVGKKGDRWLGALAHYAYKKCNSIEEAIEEFESITGQYAEDGGCECCGQPHSFYEL